MVEKKIFLGGLNVDDALSVIAEGDYRNAENIRVVSSDEGGVGSLKNVPSTVRVNNPDLEDVFLPSIRGACKDVENDRVLFFVGESGRRHPYIFSYEFNTNDIYKVFDPSELIVFQYNQPGNQEHIQCVVVNGILYWTDGISDPKKVNIDRGIKTYHPDYPSDAEPYDLLGIALNAFTVIRPAPDQPLTVSKVVSSEIDDIDDVVNNYVDTQSFQFSYRYIFKDNEVSVLAPYSRMVPYNPEGAEFDAIAYNLPGDQFILTEVQKIEFLYRIGNDGSWNVFRSIDRSTGLFDEHNSTPVAGVGIGGYFSYDYNGIQVADEIAYKPFENVPINSLTVEAANNRLFLGNNTFGYDPIGDFAMSVEIAEEDIGDEVVMGQYAILPMKVLNRPGNFYQDLPVTIIFVDSTDPTVGGWYYVKHGTTDFVNGTLPGGFAPNEDDRFMTIEEWNNVVNQDVTQVEDYFVDWAAVELVGNGFVATGVTPDFNYPGEDPTISSTGVSTGGTLRRVFKSGSSYQFGIVFYDRFQRNNGVYTDDSLIITIPEREYNQSLFEGIVRFNINEGNDRIPEWAWYYQIVRTRNLTKQSFIQYQASELKYVKGNGEGGWEYFDVFDNEVEYIAVDLTDAINQKLGYIFNEEDVVDVITPNRRYSSEVRLTSGNYVFIDPEDLGDFSNGEEDFVIEIYTPYRAGIDESFYEVGDVYRVIKPNRPDRSFSTRFGDIFGDTFIVTDSSSFLMEAMSPNYRFWQNWYDDRGRTVVRLFDTGQERKPTNICWSNTFVQGTKVNGLSVFDALDQVDLDASYGPLQKLVFTSRGQEFGNVLLAISENQTASIYIGRTQIDDAGSEALLATSGNVIGTINELKGDYGTIHPESVAEYEGKVFWFDAKNGKVIRYTSGGLFPVSDYKMKSYFRRLGESAVRERQILNEIVSVDSISFPGGYDSETDEYLLAIPLLSDFEVIETLEDYEDVILDSEIPEDRANFLAYGYKGLTYTFKYGFSPDPAPDLPIFFTSEGNIERIGEMTPSGPDFTYTPNKNGIFTIISRNADYPLILKPALISPHTVFNPKPKVLAFNDKMNRWTTSYTYEPEYFADIQGTLISWNKAELYLHNGEDFNSFYGVKNDSLVAFVVNSVPGIPKILRSVAVSSNDEPKWMHFRTEEPYIQSSDLEKGDFKRREGVYYKEVLRDRLNGEGTYLQNMFTGDDLRSRFVEVAITFDKFDDELAVYFVDVNFDVSSGHTTMYE